MEALFSKLKATTQSLRTSTAEERIKKLAALKDVLVHRRDEIVTAISNDFGKSTMESDLTEMLPLISEINYYIKNLHKWMKPKKVCAPILYTGTKPYIYTEPKGVCLIIAPWNYPFLLAINPLVSAIAAGNAVVLKPSELTPFTSGVIKRIVSEVFDDNEVAVIEGGVDVSQKLLGLPFDHIFFTGSTAVGKLVMKAACDNLASVSLELGGKSPVIIDDSANLALAAKRITWGKFVNAGQTCIAPDYILISRKNRDEFVSLLKKEIAQSYEGRWMNDFAQIITERHYQRLVHLRDEAVAKSGAKIAVEFEGPWRDRQLSPTILVDVGFDSKIMQEEIFGPILPIIIADSPDEKVALANQHANPLAMYVFADSMDTANYYIKRIPSGGVSVNETLLHIANHNLPFGGRGGSGQGKYHGHHGYLEFSHQKSVMRRSFSGGLEYFYPPYRPQKQRLVKLLLSKFSGWL